MKWTNVFGLPQEIYTRLARPSWPPQANRLSVTDLTKSPRQRLLCQRHQDEIVADVATQLWSFMGQSAHKALESLNVGHGIHEEKFDRPDLDTVEVGKYKVLVVGRPDLYLDRGDGEPRLIDLKFTGAWSFILSNMNAETKAAEYEPQLNVYKYKFWRRKFAVKHMEVWAFLRDWNQADFQQNRDKYPPCQFLVVPIKAWEKDQVEQFLRDRVLMHMECGELSDTSLPECTPAERWEKPGQWRVTKKGAKRATRCFGVDEHGAQAETMAKMMAAEKTLTAKKGETYEATFRAGEWGKCIDREIRTADALVNHRYCAAAPWCNQWKRHQEEVEREKDEQEKVQEKESVTDAMHSVRE